MPNSAKSEAGMGQLLKGKWCDDDDVIQDGAYLRQASKFRVEGSDNLDVHGNVGRYHLIVSDTCPWSHRVRIICLLKNLSDCLPTHLLSGPRVEGYALSAGRPWIIPGAKKTAIHLHQLYTMVNPDYTGRSTVPVLWDSKNLDIVTNESVDILRLLDGIPSKSDHPDIIFNPPELITQIKELNQQIYSGFNNAVYQIGFSTSDIARETAIKTVLETMAYLEHRLSDKRFLFGSLMTESDWRLFPTLVRFDQVYAPIFIRRGISLTDFPNLWDYARDLYAIPGISGTIVFEANRASSVENDVSGVEMGEINQPDWSKPHGRDRLGSGQIALRSGQVTGLIEAFDTSERRAG